MTLMGPFQLSVFRDSVNLIHTVRELNISFGFHSFVVLPFTARHPTVFLF